MSAPEHRDPVGVAVALLGAAHHQALATAQANPDSTWIDAASAIGAALGQLLASPGLAVPELDPERASDDTCIELLDAAEQALEQLPPGQRPVTLALVRSYLADAILETTGREP